MSSVLTALSVIAVGAVAVVLVMGMWNLAKRGSPNTSQSLMRLRVLLQFIAIIVLMTVLWFSGH